MACKRGIETVAALTTPTAKNKKARAYETADTRYEFCSESIEAAARASVRRQLKQDTLDSVDSILDGSRVVALTDDKRSWVYHVPGWYKRLYQVSESTRDLPYREWFAAVWDLHPTHHDSIKMFGKDVLMPRFQQVYGQSYKFSGKLFEAKPFPSLLNHALQCMQELVVDPQTGEPYAKAGLVNWYAHGDHYMGPHTDDESNIHLHSPVFSLSLGAARRFIFTPRANSISTSVANRLEIILQDGDLLIMGGTTQKTHKHALPKMKLCKEKRVSITLRCFK